MFMPSTYFLPPLILIYAISAALSLPFAELDRLLLAALLSPALVWLTLSDLSRHEIPDGSVAIIAAASAVFQWQELGNGVQFATEIGIAVILTSAIWALGEIYFRRTGNEAIGIGDAKLIGAGALAVGASSLAAMLFVASVGGIAAGLLARRHSAWRDLSGVPFGPFLAFSIFVFTLFPFPGLIYQ